MTNLAELYAAQQIQQQASRRFQELVSRQRKTERERREIEEHGYEHSISTDQ